MSRALAGLWLVAVVLAGIYLTTRVLAGITLESNILALLPRSEQDQALQQVQDRIADSLSRRIVFLVGHRDASTARAAGKALAAALEHSGLIKSLSSRPDPYAQRKMGAVYFPFRSGLLADADRTRLLTGDGQSLVMRARGQLYGPGGFASGLLLAHDPFFLLPNFFTSLPLPQTRLGLDDGILAVRDGTMTYAFVSAELSGNPYSTRFQDRFGVFTKDTIGRLVASSSGLRLLCTGAIFYASEGSSEALNETSIIGLISTLGTIALILGVFRRLRPLVLGLLSIGVGVLCAVVGTVLVFGAIYVVAMLLGVSLIGVSVDYCLQYFCEYFDPEAGTPRERLRRVLPGILLGLGTTLIGYLTLWLAPFPGLRQVAAISVIGLVGSVLTIFLWFPLLDSKSAPVLGSALVRLAGYHWTLWEAHRLWWLRAAIIASSIGLGVVGVFFFHVDDNVRHLETLSPTLKVQENEIQRLTGLSGGTQFLLVRAATEQKALEIEERLVERLSAARRRGSVAEFQAISQFVPSIKRQTENRALVLDRLNKPYLAAYLSQLGYTGSVDYAVPNRFLTQGDLPKSGPLSLISLLAVGNASTPAHVVLLGGVTRSSALAQIAHAIPGVRLVSLADDWSRLFATYRQYALLLLAVSAALMYPMLAWRYGWLSALRVMAPAVAATALAPPLVALAGISFTFFNAMALVLVLSIGVDYSVFCRETSGLRKPVTMLAIFLAALSTILAFGLLALSRVFAVHAFGVTMLLGIALSLLLAPAAGDASKRASATP